MSLDKERGERLKELMSRENVSNRTLATVADVSPSTVSQWRAGHEIRTGYLVVICPFLNTSIDYVLLGDSADLSEQDRTILQAFRRLPKKARAAALDLLEQMSGR